MTTDMICVPIRFQQHDHLNCYAGHGGTPLGEDLPVQRVHDVDACKSACRPCDGCSCFVFVSESNQCFLRSECELSKCEAGVSGKESYLFATYTRTLRRTMGKAP
jgi:hypothetical protein